MYIAVKLCLLLLQGFCLAQFSTKLSPRWAAEIPCPGNNRSADVEVLPTSNGVSLKNAFKYSNRPFALYCCATGYSYVQWYKDGVKLAEENNTKLYEYSNDTTREKLLWYSLNISECTFHPGPPFDSYECVFTCEVYSVDKLNSTSHDITVSLHPTEPRKIPVTIPEFVKAEAEDCLVEGQTLHAHCQLLFGEEEPNYAKEIEILLENGTSLVDLIDWTKPYESRRIHSRYTNALFSRVDYNVTVKNITSDFLDQTYTCRSTNTPAVTRTFEVRKCFEPPQISKDFVVVKVVVPIAVVVLLAVVATILLIRCNIYVNLWWKVHVLQRFQSHSGSYKYDVYFIYKDVTHPTVMKAKELLESVYNLSVCIPDRDFSIGAITPESIGDCLHSSEKVVMFLSNDMFSSEEKIQDWSDISLSLALALNKKTTIFLLEDIDTLKVKGKPDIKAALRVLKCLKVPDGDKKLLSQILSKTFSSPSA